MMRTNNEMVEEYATTKNLKKKSYYQLKTILNDYSDFQQAPLYDLIEEADADEDNKVKWKKRRIKTRLINYMNYSLERLDLSSAKMYLQKIKGFYRFHEIEIHNLPKFNEKNIELRTPIRYKDLPDKEIIKYAVELSEPLMAAIILYMSSSGSARIDTLSLTIEDFLRATYSYHETYDIRTAITVMNDYPGDIIPIFDSRRTKTNKFFITFCSPEATRYILNYLTKRLDKVDKRKQENLSRKHKHKVNEVKLTDKLFKITPDWLTKKFQDLNNAMNLGTVGDTTTKKGYNRFRSHMLRKFHSSNLEKAGMNRYEINVMQGKSNGKVDDVYFLEDEEVLLKNYIKYMHGILIFTEVKDFKTKEFLEMEQLLQEKEEKMKKYDEIFEKFDERIQNLEKEKYIPLSDDEIEDLLF